MPDLSRFIFSLICIIVTRPSNIPKLEQLPEDGQPSRLKSPPPHPPPITSSVYRRCVAVCANGKAPDY